MDELKAWRCASGHVMGMVMRDGGGVRRLLLYREALTPDPSHNSGRGEGVEVMAVVEGYVADVKCSICGLVRTWVPGEEAIRRLLERRGIEV